MRSHDVQYLLAAENDLVEIVDYLHGYSKNAANKFINDLDELEERLSMFPESAILMRDIRLRKKGYRMAVIGEYLLFYTLRDDIVYVMRTIHGKRNYMTML